MGRTSNCGWINCWWAPTLVQQGLSLSVTSTEAQLYVQIPPLCLDINHVGMSEHKGVICGRTSKTIPRGHRSRCCLNSAESKSSCRKSGQVHLICNHHSLIDRQIVWFILVIVVSLASGGGNSRRIHQSHQYKSRTEDNTRRPADFASCLTLQQHSAFFSFVLFFSSLTF